MNYYGRKVLMLAVLMAAAGKGGKGGGGGKGKPPEAPQPPAAGSSAGTALAKIDGPMVVQSDKLPDYIRKDTARGSENVSTEDLVIPRLEVIQDLSPQLDEDSGEYIAGAKAGMLTNSVTNQLYGSEVMVVPVHYTKQYLVWKSREKGGGFFGAYPTPKEAEDRVQQEGGKAQGVEAIDTPTHLCLLINQHSGTVDEVILSMPRTKAKVSRQWNSMIRMAGGDRFSRVYRIATTKEENAKGKFHNYVVATSGFPHRTIYQMAEKLFAAVSKGDRNVVMDTKNYNAGPAGGGDETTEM